MPNRAHRRSRRPLTLAAVAIGLGAASSVGAWAGGLVRSAPKPAGAQAKAAAVWVAGEQSKPRAAKARPARARPAKAEPVAVTPRRAKPATHGGRRLTANVAFTLCANAGTIDVAGTPTAVWGFALADPTGSCAGIPPSLPGPELHVHVGDTVSVTVINNLPPLPPPGVRTVTFQAPGVDFAPGPQDVTGTPVTFTFTAAEGTYLYSSTGDAGRQAAMGLYGALVVQNAVATTADGVPITRDQVLLLSEVDPAFNANPDAYDLNNWKPTIWLINGKAAPGTDAIHATAGDRILLRWLNAGMDHNTMTMLGIRQQLLRQNGSLLANPYSVVSTTFPAGSTAEGLVTVPSPAASSYAIYNRNLNMGMATAVQVP